MDNFWYVFGVFGLVVAGIICVIAVVWLTCFSVKTLIKSFGTTVKSFNAVEKENIEKKFAAKKERVALKREQSIAHKNEILKLKMEKNDQIQAIKMQKLEKKLNDKVLNVASKNGVDVKVETKYDVFEENVIKDNTTDDKITNDENK